MKAFILAAGKGTRLKPLTDTTPKALISIEKKTLLELNIRKMLHFGYNEIIVNTHYLGSEVKRFLENNKFNNSRIVISDESDLLLDTGGGLLKAKWFFDDNSPFLVHNVDILSNIDFKQMLDTHKSNKCLATLAISNRKSSKYLLFDEDMHLIGWKNEKTGEIKFSKSNITKYQTFAFSGIQMINKEIFDYVTINGVFSLIDMYLELAKQNNIGAFIHESSGWMDVGTPEKLKQAQERISEFNYSV